MALPLAADLSAAFSETAQQTVGSGKSRLRVTFDADEWREVLIKSAGSLERAVRHGYVKYDPAGGTAYTIIKIQEWDGGVIDVAPTATFVVGSARAPTAGAAILVEEF